LLCQVDCNICCDEYEPNEAFGMGCGHVYCLNCWKPYLSLKIQEGPVCVTTTCPAHGCKEVSWPGCSQRGPRVR